MQKISLICSALVLVGCALPPQQKADISYCSELTGGTGPLSRIGNDAYWDCLKAQPHGAERERKYQENRRLAQEREEQRLAIEEKKRQENVQTAIAPHKQICKEAGFREDTDAFSNCVMASYQNSLDAINRANQARINNAPDYTRFLQPPSPPKQTNCTFFGNTATCVE